MAVPNSKGGKITLFPDTKETEKHKGDSQAGRKAGKYDQSLHEQNSEDFRAELSRQKSQINESSKARRCKQRYARTPRTHRKKPPLEILNHSWNKGLVPEAWKTALFVAVLKPGKDKTSPGSYHPISLLSCVGKLMESAITRCLTWFLETSNVSSPSQTGYCHHFSTENQLALLIQDTENSFQEKRKMLAVFCDLSNAYDPIWKKGLQCRRCC